MGAAAPTRFAALAGFLALGVLTTTACTTTRSTVASVPPASAVTTPSTVAPVAPATTAPSTVVTTTPTSAPSTTTATTVLSPLAAELGERYSVLPEPVSNLPEPVALSIDGIRLTGAPVIPVGVDPTGELEVPDEKSVGWYDLGSRPGEPGAVVLASHVSWNGKRGLFERLANVEPGERAVVTLADGGTRTYEVVERTMYGKEGLPADRVWTHVGPETLVLITCGGRFDPSVKRYRDNIVVYAVPVA